MYNITRAIYSQKGNITCAKIAFPYNCRNVNRTALTYFHFYKDGTIAWIEPQKRSQKKVVPTYYEKLF